MAKAKKTNDEQSIVKPATASDITENEELELTEAEKTALEVSEASAKGESLPKVKYKLANPNTSYQEPGFTLVGDQEKELPESPSNELIARIQWGFIVKA